MSPAVGGSAGPSRVSWRDGAQRSPSAPGPFGPSGELAPGSYLLTVSLPGHAPFPSNRYVIAKGDARQLVLYWYWAHDRGVASEYWAKVYLVTDSMRMNRSDGALVRLTTTMYPGETSDAAQQRLLPLASDIVPVLDNYIPR